MMEPLSAAADGLKRRRKLLVVLAGVLALLAVGVAAWLLRPGVDEPAVSPTPDAARDRTELTYAVHWSDSHVEGVYEDGTLKYKGLNQYLEEYERLHEDVHIETVFLELADYSAGVRLLHDAGQAPDIYQIHSTWGASMARDGILAEPPEGILGDVRENYDTAGVTIDGKIWGIPTEVGDYLLLYNKEMFKEAGIVDAQGNARAPKDWAEAVDIASGLARKDSQGRLTRDGFAFLSYGDDFITDPFLSVLFTNGGEYLSADLKRCLLNEPGGVAALDGVLELFRRGATDADGNPWEFSEGKVAMAIVPPWVEHDLKTRLGDRFDTVVGLAPIPPMKKRATMQYGWFIGVTQGSKEKEKAWEFLRWFTSEVQPTTGTTRYSDLLAQTVGAIPSRKNDLFGEGAFLGSFRRPFVDELPYAVHQPNVPDAAAAKSFLRDEIRAAWAGQKTAQAALDSACAAIDELLRR